MSEVKFQTQLINDQKLSAECVDVACPVSRGAKEEKGETCRYQSVMFRCRIWIKKTWISFSGKKVEQWCIITIYNKTYCIVVEIRAAEVHRILLQMYLNEPADPTEANQICCVFEGVWRQNHPKVDLPSITIY